MDHYINEGEKERRRKNRIEIKEKKKGVTVNIEKTLADNQNIVSRILGPRKKL